MNDSLEDGGMRQGTSEMRAKARAFRRDATIAEAIFWQAVRNGKISGVRFRRQHDLPRVLAQLQEAVSL